MDEPTEVRKGPGNTRAKGKRLVKLAKTLLEAQGALVETAPLQVKWLGANRPVMLSGDYFDIWDLIAVYPDGRRGFVQVTTWNHATDRRNKILGAGFFCTEHDLILGYMEGQGRHFRVLVGPDFDTRPDNERWSLDVVEQIEEDEAIILAAEC